MLRVLLRDAFQHHRTEDRKGTEVFKQTLVFALQNRRRGANGCVFYGVTHFNTAETKDGMQRPITIPFVQLTASALVSEREYGCVIPCDAEQHREGRKTAIHTHSSRPLLFPHLSIHILGRTRPVFARGRYFPEWSCGERVSQRPL